MKNDGSVPQYYVKDDHEAIIPRDIFTNVQQEIIRRGNLVSGKGLGHKRVYSSKYALSSICICAKCGDIYQRVPWQIREKHVVVWRCCTRKKKGPSYCDSPSIKEEDLQAATIKAINQVLKCSDEMKSKLNDNIAEILNNDKSEVLKKLEAQLLDKQKELMSMIHAKKDYSSLLEEIDKLKSEKEKFLIERSEMKSNKERIMELDAFIDGADSELDCFDDILVRRYIDKIIIHEDKFEFFFKANIGVTIMR